MKGIYLLLALSLLIIPLASGADYITFYSETGTDTYAPMYVSNYSGCSMYASCYFNYSSYSTVESKYYSNYTNFLYNVNSAGGTNVFCGDYEAASLSDYLKEFRIYQDLTDVTYVTSNISCPTRSDYIVYNFTAVDSNNYLTNVMASDTITVLNSSVIAGREMSAEIYPVPYSQTYGAGTATDQHRYVIFDSGYGYPEVYIYRKAMGCNPTPYFDISVYQYDNSSNIDYYLHDTSGITSDEAYNLTSIELINNTLYVLDMRFHCYTAYPGTPIFGSYGYIRSHDYTPNIQCGNWSECDNATASIKRYCEDLNGIIDPYYEYEECPGASENEFDDDAYLGFHNMTTIDVPVCVPDWTVLGCTNYVVNKSVLVPANWDFTDIFTMGYANYPEGFTPYRMRGWVDLGGYKLQMWNTVPKPYEAVYNWSGTNQWECVNWTGWSPSWLTQNVSNTTMSADYNITFPEENMKMWFSIKKCGDQQLQYSHDECSYFFGLGSLGDLCYSADCEDAVKGGYKFGIYDWSTGTYIYEYEGTAYDDWRTYYFDLSDVGLVAGNTYRIQVQTYDPDYTNQGTCIELWNFGYGISSDDFTCTSYCDDLTYHYYQAIVNDNGLCIQEDTGFSSTCVPDQIDLDNYETCTSFCDINGNYHSGSNVTGICLWTYEEDSTICEEEQTIYDPNVELGDGQVYDLIENLSSLFGIISLVLALICFKMADKNSALVVLGIIFMIIFLIKFGYLETIYLVIILAAAAIIFTRSVVDTTTK